MNVKIQMIGGNTIEGDITNKLPQFTPSDRWITVNRAAGTRQGTLEVRINIQHILTIEIYPGA